MWGFCSKELPATGYLAKSSGVLVGFPTPIKRKEGLQKILLLSSNPEPTKRISVGLGLSFLPELVRANICGNPIYWWEKHGKTMVLCRFSHQPQWNVLLLSRVGWSERVWLDSWWWCMTGWCPWWGLPAHYGTRWLLDVMPPFFWVCN